MSAVWAIAATAHTSEQIRQLEASDQPDGKLDDNLELDNLELNQNPCGEKGGIVPAGLRGLTLEVVPEVSLALRISVWSLQDITMGKLVGLSRISDEASGTTSEVKPRRPQASTTTSEVRPRRPPGKLLPRSPEGSKPETQPTTTEPPDRSG